MVIPRALHDFERAIELFYKHKAAEFVRKGHLAQAQVMIGTIFDCIRDSKSPAEDEDEWAAVVVGLGDNLGKLDG